MYAYSMYVLTVLSIFILIDFSVMKIFLFNNNNIIIFETSGKL